jgi:hypothetical protein
MMMLAIAVPAFALPYDATNVTAGGWLPSTIDGNKATFGFHAALLEPVPTDLPGYASFFYEAEGSLEYKDHGTKMAIHGDVTTMQVFVGDGFQVTWYLGTYRTQPKGGTGTFWIVVTDREQLWPLGTLFQLQLSNGYYNEGYVQGGNAQFHAAN